jgi:hypothetical protein
MAVPADRKSVQDVQFHPSVSFDALFAISEKGHSAIG